MPSCDKSMTITDQAIILQIFIDHRVKINLSL